MAIQAALAVLAALTVIGGAGAAAVATGVVNLNGNGTMNLGALSSGMNGTATVKSTVYLNNTANYKFEMEKEDQTGSAFSTFLVYVTVNGTTYNLSNGNPHDYKLKLTAGSHTFTVKLEYAVKNVGDSINATKVPFLFLHETGSNSGSGNAQDNFNVVNDKANADSYNGTYVIAYLSFTFNNNKQSQGEDSGTDNTAQKTVL